MELLTMLLWGCLISSTVVIFGYEIWNVFVVTKDLVKVYREANEQ